MKSGTKESTMRAARLDTATRREQIARAALEVIDKEGIRGLGVAKIARRVGVVPSAIYRHFRSKAEVIDLLIEFMRTRVLGNVEAVQRESADPVECLHRLLLRHIQLIRKYQMLPRLLFAEEVFIEQPGRRESFRTLIEAFLPEVAKLFRRAQREGTVRRDIDARAFARMFLGLFQPSAVVWHVTGRTFNMKRQAEKAWKVFSQGITSPRKHSRSRSCARRS
jgi:AcrR family transcriptional regulator